MGRVRIVFFAPDAYKIPENLETEASKVYDKKIKFDFLFNWEPPTVSEMRATGICDELDEICWKGHTKNFYCNAQITTLIEKITDHKHFLFLTTHNPILRATTCGMQSGSAVAHPEGKHLAVAPFWDMDHILHEVGHLLELDHCKDGACIMHEGHLHKQRHLCKRHKLKIRRL